MTVTAATSGGNDTSVTAYEALRAYVLAGDNISPSGLGVLLRQGMVAWMVHRSAGVAPTLPASSTPLATPIVGNEIYAAMVRVLASMALAGQQELCV